MSSNYIELLKTYARASPYRDPRAAISDAIFEEINLNYGDTLDEEVDFSSFCSLYSVCNVKND